MADGNLRVWPIEGDGFGDEIAYPKWTKYRMEPQFPGATGDVNHDLVIYEKDEDHEEHELARHKLTEVMIAYAGQPTPAAVTAYLDAKELDSGSSTGTRSSSKTETKASSTNEKAGTAAKK
jgi:hypothetical protein